MYCTGKQKVSCGKKGNAFGNPRMFVTDLDGTLLRSDKTFDPKDICALKRLGDLGVCRVLATGRSLFSLGLVRACDLPIDYIIFSTGCGIMNLEGRKIIRRVGLSASQARRAAALFLKMDVDFSVHRLVPHNHFFGYHLTREHNPDFSKYIKRYDGFARRLTSDHGSLGPSTQILAIVPEKYGESVLQTSRKKLLGLNVVRTTSPVDMESMWVEVFSPKASKSLAAAWLGASLGLCRSQAVCVGNDYNDLDMLEWARWSYVVENSPESLKKRFCHTASHNHCGVSQVIDRHWPV